MTCTPLLSLAVLLGPAVAFAQGPQPDDPSASSDRVDMTMTFRPLKQDCLANDESRERFRPGDDHDDEIAGRFEAGTAVLLEVVTRNRGPDEFRFTSNLPLSDLKIAVIGPDGQPAGPTRYGTGELKKAGREFFGRMKFLKPGQSFMEFRCVFNQVYDVSVEGKYVVSVSRTVQVYPQAGGAAVVREIHSAPMAILITPPSVPHARDLDSIEPVRLSEEEWEAVRRMRAARGRGDDRDRPPAEDGGD